MCYPLRDTKFSWEGRIGLSTGYDPEDAWLPTRTRFLDNLLVSNGESRSGDVFRSDRVSIFDPPGSTPCTNGTVFRFPLYLPRHGGSKRRVGGSPSVGLRVGHGEMAGSCAQPEGKERDLLLQEIEEELPWPALKLVADHYERKMRQERCPTEQDIREGNVRPGDYLCWQDEGYFCFPAKVFAIHRETNEEGEGHCVYHVVALVRCPCPKERDTVGCWSNYVCCPANGVDQESVTTLYACHDKSESFRGVQPADIMVTLDAAMHSIFATDYCE